MSDEARLLRCSPVFDRMLPGEECRKLMGGPARESAEAKAAPPARVVSQISRPAAGSRLGLPAGEVLALQSMAGNRAATQAVGGLLQRQPAKTPPAKPQTTAADDLGKRMTALEKRTDMLQLDMRYGALFQERLSSYKRAVLRITGGLQAAQKGFTKAQNDQARFDALVTQLLIAGGAVGLAFGFEPLLTAELGLLGRTTKQIEKTVEFWENPVLQAAGSTSNIYPLAKDGDDAGGVPADVDPTAYLTKNLEALEAHNQGLERAFATRLGGIMAADNEKLDALDVNGWEALYSSLYKELTASCKGVESLKTDRELGPILERHIWAAWIRAQTKLVVTMEDGKGQLVFPADKADPSKPLPPGERYVLDLGSEIEAELNNIGISTLAGVTLRAHWYRGNDPDDWAQRLLTWACAYNEVITVAPPKKTVTVGDSPHAQP